MYESGDYKYKQNNAMTHHNNLMSKRGYLQTEESSNPQFDRGKIKFIKDNLDYAFNFIKDVLAKKVITHIIVG